MRHATSRRCAGSATASTRERGAHRREQRRVLARQHGARVEHHPVLLDPPHHRRIGAAQAGEDINEQFCLRHSDKHWQGRVIDASTGLTKLDLVRYYHAVDDR